MLASMLGLLRPAADVNALCINARPSITWYWYRCPLCVNIRLSTAWCWNRCPLCVILISMPSMRRCQALYCLMLILMSSVPGPPLPGIDTDALFVLMPGPLLPDADINVLFALMLGPSIAWCWYQYSLRWCLPLILNLFNASSLPSIMLGDHLKSASVLTSLGVWRVSRANIGISVHFIGDGPSNTQCLYQCPCCRSHDTWLSWFIATITS